MIRLEKLTKHFGHGAHPVVAVDDVTLGPLTGDLTIVAEGVPLDPDAPTRVLRVRYAIPESELSALTPEITGVTITDVSLQDGELVVLVLQIAHRSQVYR